MLRRFQRISGVGCFADCHPPQVQFEHMSLVYGENCYGKSTLCDILRSFGENVPDYVTERTSVPRAGDGSQQVQVGLDLPDQTQESVFSFRRGAWTPTMSDSLRLDVFDTDFIHRNIFTGLSIERPNRENITRFVLGESGVIIFRGLGSRRFAISAKQSRRGNMPTIQVHVSFNGVPIAQSRLRAFFSESDRRALALAVFWARLQTRDDEEQRRTVVVLDDPVTSFDHGRIDRTIRLVESQLPRLRQMIILSHYPEYLKTFFTRLLTACR